MIKLPVDDIAGVPIHDSVQIHPSLRHADVGDVNRPYLIGLDDIQLPKQIRIDPMLQVSLAQVRPWVDCHDAHLAHVAPYGILVDSISFPIHDHCDSPVAQMRVLREYLVNPVLEANLLRGGRDRFVVKAGAIQAKQIGLNVDREFGAVPFQQVNALVSSELIRQIFF